MYLYNSRPGGLQAYDEVIHSHYITPLFNLKAHIVQDLNKEICFFTVIELMNDRATLSWVVFVGVSVGLTFHQLHDLQI